ncbi:hypothetical protein GGQ54_001951 [Naumannella cuiyingiana]|uniref:DUF4244 domain-containing protein n=1 Tax=Naumannella cuiyingiana TaxID=1347891 RepID=A0A7Z0ILC1_9ACTN|nr:DUF4244 domain-containing protein [Naumannella cuiyingiana]NYI71391.1 hypothetical protein [Naumannella cuiyingiana]
MINEAEKINRGADGVADVVGERPAAGGELVAVHPRPQRDERGMSTAEYAVGTVAAVSFAGVLLKVLTDPNVQRLLVEFIIWLIGLFTGLDPFGTGAPPTTRP